MRADGTAGLGTLQDDFRLGSRRLGLDLSIVRVIVLSSSDSSLFLGKHAILVSIWPSCLWRTKEQAVKERESRRQQQKIGDVKDASNSRV